MPSIRPVSCGNGAFGTPHAEHPTRRPPRLRIWYAEGKVRPAPLLPLVTIRAVLCLRHSESQDHTGRQLLRHHADVFLQADSKTAALATRLFGASAPRLAEQCLAQLEMF